MKRLYVLDALRGFAALAVVLWHWQFFFFLPNIAQPHLHPGWLPFVRILGLFYGWGWLAVQLFFALSGFVFFWLYSEAVAAGRIGAGTFFLLRFSRLYPLYIATLLTVALLEAVCYLQTGHYFIYDSGSWEHFATALLMAQQWLPPFQSNYFNGPAWSVSVEVFLYIIFFLFCRAGLISPLARLLIAVSGTVLLWRNGLIAFGVAAFFVGGAVRSGTLWVERRPDSKYLVYWISAAAVLVWSALIGEAYFGVLHAAVYRITGFISPNMQRLANANASPLMELYFVYIVSPITIAALVLLEKVRKVSFSSFAFLGDVSYSVYLWHFPLQLVFALCALWFGWTPATFLSPFMLPLFILLLLALGGLSHYGFEKPLQNAIRGNIRSRAPAV